MFLLNVGVKVEITVSILYIYIIVADEKPKMSELNKHLVKYCGLWRAIGLKLGLEDDLLETISRDNSKQHQECFRVMLQKWLVQDVSSTWNTLELAITNAQRDDLSLDNISESMYMECVCSCSISLTLITACLFIISLASMVHSVKYCMAKDFYGCYKTTKMFALISCSF